MIGKRLLIWLILIFLKVNAGTDIKLGMQSLNLQSANSSEGILFFTLGASKTARLSDHMGGIPKLFYLSGSGDICFREADQDIGFSAFTDISLLVGLYDAIKLGPGIGVYGLFRSRRTYPANESHFFTLYSLTARVDFPGTFFGASYRYLFYFFEGDFLFWHHGFFLHCNLF